MSEKQKLIQEMLAMQKKFIAREQAEGIELEDYYNSESEGDLGDYQAKYNELANRLVDLAHEEKGSSR